MTAAGRRSNRDKLGAIAIGLFRWSIATVVIAALPSTAGAETGAAAIVPGAAPADSVRAFLNDGRYAEAEVGARALVAAHTADADASSPTDSLAHAHAEALDLLVEALWRGGRSGEDSTLALAEESVALRETAGGVARSELWQSLDNLATIHRERGDYDAARGALARAVAVCDSAFEPNDHRTAIVLNSLGIILEHAGETDGALAAHTRALAIREALYGPDNFMVSQSLHSLGVLSLRMTDYLGARRYFERAVRIREKELGPTHRELAATLVNLAIALFSRGEYLEARAPLERATKILETTLGPDHPDVAVAYNNLGAILGEMGDPGGALPAFERALAITETRFGRDHLGVAGYCCNIGSIEKEIGDVDAAEQHFRRALAIFDSRPPGPYQPDAILAMNAFAGILAARGEVDSARTLGERAVATAESTLGADSPMLASALEALADLIENAGEHAAAGSHLERAIMIRRDAQGAGHPAVANGLTRLARIAWRDGDLARASALESDARDILHGSLGAGHPSTAEAEARLARYLAAAGDTTRAFALALRSEESMRAHLRLASRGLSERQSLAYTANRVSSLDTALEIAAASSDPAVHRAAWDAGVRSRAIVLDEMAARVRGAERGVGAETSRLATEYAAVSRRLANLVVRGLGADEPDAYRVLLDGARRERDAAERALAAQSDAFRREASDRAIGLDGVLASLPGRSALVAYFRTEPEGGLGASHYVAFVARADHGDAGAVARSGPAASAGGDGAARAVPLGSASVIDGAVRGWRRLVGLGVTVGLNETGALPDSEPAKLTTETGGSKIVDHAAAPVAEHEAAAGSAGASLRALVWDPLVPHLAGVDRVFIVPDAALTLINFAALPDESGAYLVETGPVVHLVSAERDLATDAANAPSSEAGGLLALGGPDFDTAPWLDASTSGNAGASASALPGAAAYRGARPACASFARLQFERLPGAEQEARDIAALWKEHAAANGRRGIAARSTELTGRDATETALKRAAHEQSVLHLATHGFFLSDLCLSLDARSRGIGGLAPSSAGAGPGASGANSGAPPNSPTATRVYESTPSTDPSSPTRREENPLRFAGLVLAGANHRVNAGPDEEDGILTAEEIAALDLSRVTWCVLSACETGVADTYAGEGVLSLRRAVQVAGARTLISSLWPVRDEATRAWMRALYEARLRGGLDTAASVQAASRTILAERRARGASTHPFLWAGFVASGDWR
ncbi:MAG: CHAT domain-containing protein [bacterium]